MDRPDGVPESAEPSFGGLVWSDGTALWVRRGEKVVMTPMQIRGMSDHLETKEELTEFWGRYLKDEGVAEAVVDWLMPVDMRPPMVGALLPDDEPGVVGTPEGRFQMPAQRSPANDASKCPCWGQDAGPGGYCQKCGHLLTCENCCHRRKAQDKAQDDAPQHSLAAAPIAHKVVAAAPVQLEAQPGPYDGVELCPHGLVSGDPDCMYCNPPPKAIHQPSGLPVCHCGSGLPEYEGCCPMCHPASKKIAGYAVPPNEVQREAENQDRPMQIMASAPVPIKLGNQIDWDAIPPINPPINPETAIVKAPRAPAVRVREEWWDDEEAMDTLKGIIGRGATDFQVKWLFWFCKGLRLNPFAGEASWSAQWGRPVIDVSGYRGHANRRPEFRRMISGKVYKDETFSFDQMSGKVVHVIGMEQDPAKFLFAYAIVYRNDRDSPTFVTQSMKEFMPGWKPWSGETGKGRKQAAQSAGYDAFPADKLQAKAERKALAKAFSLGGLSDEDIRDGDTGE